MFSHFLKFTQYKNNTNLKVNFYISSILGISLLGLTIIERFTSIISSITIIIILLTGGIIVAYFEWPLIKKYNAEVVNKEI